MGPAIWSALRQFPQGGINQESAEQAMYRELFEEVGLSRKDVRILASTRNWLRYKLPKRLVRWDTKPVCIGQKQKWFLLQLMSADAEINMQTSSTPEFDGWRWVSYWYPVRQVVSFKRDVYRRVMKEFASVVMALQDNPLSYKARLLIDVKRLSHANYAHSPARNSRKVASAPRLNEALNILVTDICLAMDTEVCSVYGRS